MGCSPGGFSSLLRLLSTAPLGSRCETEFASQLNRFRGSETVLARSLEACEARDRRKPRNVEHNSPARHRTSRVQYDLTPRDAIARRYFYVWRDREFRAHQDKVLQVGSLLQQGSTRSWIRCWSS